MENFKLNILYLVEQKEYSRYYKNLISEFNLLKNAPKVNFLNISYDSKFSKSIITDGHKIHSLKIKGSYFLNFYKVLIGIKKIKPHIIHSHEITPSFFGALYKILFPKTKLIFHRHHNDSKSKKLKILSLFTTLLADKIICVSNASKKYAISEFPFSNGKVEVIYNAISSKTEVKEQINFQKPGFGIVLGMLSRFRPEKRHDLALLAVKKLVERGYDCCLICAGDGPTLSEIKKKTSELNLSNRTFFLGKVEQIECFFDIIDYHLIPSDLESFGLASIEAMQNRVVNIASSVGGVIEIIENNKTGILFNKGDLNDFVQKIKFIIDRPNLKTRIEHNGYLNWEKRFSPRVMAKKYLDSYVNLQTSNKWKS